nr:MAG TPA: hypothetical protein [Caudoviricetes sp.]
MLMNISIGFYVLGALLMIIIAILFGLMLLTDSDRLSTVCEKLFGVTVIVWAIGVLLMIIDMIFNFSEYHW